MEIGRTVRAVLDEAIEDERMVTPGVEIGREANGSGKTKARSSLSNQTLVPHFHASHQ